VDIAATIIIRLRIADEARGRRDGDLPVARKIVDLFTDVQETRCVPHRRAPMTKGN
jgi:hypothetical protein